MKSSAVNDVVALENVTEATNVHAIESKGFLAPLEMTDRPVVISTTSLRGGEIPCY